MSIEVIFYCPKCSKPVAETGQSECVCEFQKRIRELETKLIDALYQVEENKAITIENQLDKVKLLKRIDDLENVIDSLQLKIALRYLSCY